MYKASRKYGLQGTDAMVFEALVWLSRQTKDGAVKISYSKLAEFSLCGTRGTAFYAIERLIAKGIVFKIGTGVFKIGTEVFKNDTEIKEERTKEENINKKEVCLKSDTQHTTFSSFFKIFSPNGEYKSYREACKKIWETLPEDWRKMACERASEYAAEKRNPLFFLKDEDYLFVSSQKEQKPSPQWLTGVQQDELLRDGVPVVVCQNPLTGKFGAVTKDDADKFGLTIKRQM